MRLTTDQFQAITRHRYLGGPRPAGVPHISIADLGLVEFHRVTGWWAQFDAWQGWLDGRKRDPRPKVWRLVPLFAWQLRRELLKARKPTNTTVTPPPAPPEPPLTIDAARFRNLVFAAQNPLAALAAPPKYTVLFTADPAYDGWASAGAADQLRQAGHKVGVWYVPTEVSKARAEEVLRRVGGTLLLGEGETRPQFWASVHDGLEALIGNLSDTVADPDAVKVVAVGKVAYVNEFYWNQSRGRRPDNHQLPVVSLCIACYDGHLDSSASDAWAPHTGDYKAAGYWWDTMSVYGPGMTQADYEALP